MGSPLALVMWFDGAVANSVCPFSPLLRGEGWDEGLSQLTVPVVGAPHPTASQGRSGRPLPARAGRGRSPRLGITSVDLLSPRTLTNFQPSSTAPASPAAA